MRSFISIMLALLSAFLGVDRYYQHFSFVPVLPVYVMPGLSFLGMLIGFMGVRGKKSKKKRRAPMRCGVINLIVCLAVTGLLLAEVVLGWRVSFR